ncbi:tRNA (adenosine(37)-N6)-dimethylallyltransferase MiaA [Chloroflexota bacterium]
MISLITILGPTAVGKSSLALELCQELNGEIVSADSRQVYRYMDIGTAKASQEEQALVPHHLIDVVNPDQDFSLALYQKITLEAIAGIERKEKKPFLVGGSGLYVWSLVEGWRIPQVPPDLDFRKELEDRAQSQGGEDLHSELKKLDPAAAESIDPRNIRRVIRALEVCRQGANFSQLGGKKPFFCPLIIGLTTERADLYQRIDNRVDIMIKQGLLKETQGLVDRGYGFDLPAMSGLGYRQIGSFLKGEIDLPTAIEKIKFETHRFARRQYSWFRLGDERIHWFDIRNDFRDDVYSLIQDFLKCNSRTGSCCKQPVVN